MKKTNLLKTLSLLFVLAVIISSCGKYEEGPKMSLASKKSRMTNKWKLDEIYDDGKKEELTADDKYIFELTKDNKVRFIQDGVTIELGTWDFDSSKEYLVITDTDGDSHKEKILRLTKKELWLVDEHDGHKHETRYVSAD